MQLVVLAQPQAEGSHSFATPARKTPTSSGKSSPSVIGERSLYRFSGLWITKMLFMPWRGSARHSNPLRWCFAINLTGRKCWSTDWMLEPSYPRELTPGPTPKLNTRNVFVLISDGLNISKYTYMYSGILIYCILHSMVRFLINQTCYLVHLKLLNLCLDFFFKLPYM